MRKAEPVLVRLALVGLLTASTFSGATEEGGSEWRRVEGPPELAFPRDHGAHPDYRTEWWYATGLVSDARGRRYGFQITFFRQGLAPGPRENGSSQLRARQVMVAHLAIADIERREFYHGERLRRSDDLLAGFNEDDLGVWLDDWEMERRSDGTIFVRAGESEGIGMSLQLRPKRELVAHGDRGYSQKGAEPGNASAYLSWTRLEVDGSLRISGSDVEVDGNGWFDHEWGSSTLGEGVEGWDWFSLRLEDGRDLMIYRLRRSDGLADPRSSGTLLQTDGTVMHLERDDFEVEVLDEWPSLATGGRYPTRWRLRIPSEGINLDVAALVPAAELDGSATTGVIYWEGPVEATGSTTGEGYVEMTGYAGSLEGRF